MGSRNMNQANAELLLDLERRVKSLEDYVRELNKAVADLTLLVQNPPAPPVNLLRGKYTGKSRDWVVRNDPRYVVFLSGLSSWGSWGFTQEQLEAAKKAAAELGDEEGPPF